MDKIWLLDHLREAHEQLTHVIAELGKPTAVDMGEFEVALRHIYHHLNTAWNSRNVVADDISATQAENFNVWRRFPSDISMD